ncbi:hypothetical protein MPSEU_000872800 [Mayamaea pseudoterrestris]|nr:hypothetical protein MPSEU_000872800 [Mayamaea pseudoterrestris]
MYLQSQSHRTKTSIIMVILLSAWGMLTTILDDRRNRQVMHHQSEGVLKHLLMEVEATLRKLNETNMNSAHINNNNYTAIERLAMSYETQPPPFWPNLALEKYKLFHSAEALRREFADAAKAASNKNNDSNNSSSNQYSPPRKYAVAYYWCPDRSGNVLHNLMWSMAWAVTHHRTLLLEYVAPHLAYNAQQDCDSVMRLQEWIPTMSEFHKQVFGANSNSDNDSSNDVIVMPVPLDVQRLRYDLRHKVVVYPQIPDMQSLVDDHYSSKAASDSKHNNETTFSSLPLIFNRRLYTQEWGTEPLKYSAYVRSLPVSMEATFGMLHKYGTDYLVGMLLRHSIINLYEKTSSSAKQQYTSRRELIHRNKRRRRKYERKTTDDAKRIKPSLFSATPPAYYKEDDHISIALHSRHVVLGDDGSFVDQEKRCLQQVLQRFTQAQKQQCTIYLMSDRPKTLTLLADWLRASTSTKCTPIYIDASDHLNSSLRLTEHGVHAGRGYWQDWAMATQAKSAVIGDTRRSSYKLVKATIVYDRVMHVYQKYLDVNVTKYMRPLVECELPSRPSSGYSYGYHSPQFTHYSLAAPLQPVQVLDSYKNKMMQQQAAAGQVRDEEEHDDGGESVDIDDDGNAATPSTKYFIAYYACPLNAKGDGLERFMNDLLLGVATNRTLLVKYWDYETCRQRQGAGCQHNLRNQTACDELLTRADWMWSYDDYLKEHAAAAAQGDVAPVLVTNIHSKSWQHANVVEFPTMTRQELQRLLLGSGDESSRQTRRLSIGGVDVDTTTKLFEQGPAFLYGLLFHEAFQLSPIVRHDAFASDFPGAQQFTNSLSIAMLPGANSLFDNELSCLTSIIRSQPAAPTCHVLAAPDPAVVVSEELMARVSQMSCTVWTINNADITNEDHFSQSLSFLRSTLLASYARSGIIGMNQPSMALDWIEYKRRVEVWKLGRQPPILPALTRCDPADI